MRISLFDELYSSCDPGGVDTRMNITTLLDMQIQPTQISKKRNVWPASHSIFFPMITPTAKAVHTA